MSTAMFLAWSSPVSPEAEDEFNDWYVNTHVPQVREAVPAVTAVRRYALLGSGGEAGPRRYLCCYELADADAAGAAQALSSAAEQGRFEMTPAMDRTTAPPELQFLEPVD
ncbi:hypothetical protein ACIQVL_50635 [Streptomyces sp. NPDC090499]|uniref:hypothetical protein n=1 Tax=Streptomyces sp. NPDC090499 TaxID=3365965 RepID=UPI003814426F